MVFSRFRILPLGIASLAFIAAAAPARALDEICGIVSDPGTNPVREAVLALYSEAVSAGDKTPQWWGEWLQRGERQLSDLGAWDFRGILTSLRRQVEKTESRPLPHAELAEVEAPVEAAVSSATPPPPASAVPAPTRIKKISEYPNHVPVNVFLDALRARGTLRMLGLYRAAKRAREEFAYEVDNYRRLHPNADRAYVDSARNIQVPVGYFRAERSSGTWSQVSITWEMDRLFGGEPVKFSRVGRGKVEISQAVMEEGKTYTKIVYDVSGNYFRMMKGINRRGKIIGPFGSQDWDAYLTEYGNLWDRPEGIATPDYWRAFQAATHFNATL